MQRALSDRTLPVQRGEQVRLRKKLLCSRLRLM